MLLHSSCAAMLSDVFHVLQLYNAPTSPLPLLRRLRGAVSSLLCLLFSKPRVPSRSSWLGFVVVCVCFGLVLFSPSCAAAPRAALQLLKDRLPSRRSAIPPPTPRPPPAPPPGLRAAPGAAASPRPPGAELRNLPAPAAGGPRRPPLFQGGRRRDRR